MPMPACSASTDFDFTTAPPADTTPPTLSTTTPADNSTNVAVSANLVLTFSENVMAGSGNLVIHNAADGSPVATIAITDASQVSFAGSTLTINPTSDLAPGTHYYVTLASGVVQDLAGNAFAGLSASTDFDFTTAPPADTTPPTLSTTTPADNSTNVAVGANLVLTFSESVKAGSGNVVIHNALDGSAVATIAITDASQVSFAGSVLTINPTSDLALGTHYYVTMASGVVRTWRAMPMPASRQPPISISPTMPPADTTPPTLSATTPADNSTNVAVASNLVLTFSENVMAGSGNLVIHKASDGSIVATIAITDASQVSFAGSVLTINPTSDLAAGTHYYVTLASGVVQDLAGNAFAGLSAATDFDFTTVAQAALKVRYDFDGDGHSDILLQNDSGQAAVWLMNGTNVVTTGNVGTADPTWHVKSAGDFDGDGKADILLQNDSGQAAVWLMNGTTLLSSTNVGANLGTSWHVKSAGDFNGDGKADILWQNDSGQAAIWLMNGTNVLSSGTIAESPGTTWHVMGAGDFNGDGKADILWQNDNGQAAVWLMNGTTRAGSALRLQYGGLLAYQGRRRFQRRRQVRHPVAERQRPGRGLADERTLASEQPQCRLESRPVLACQRRRGFQRRRQGRHPVAGRQRSGHGLADERNHGPDHRQCRRQSRLAMACDKQHRPSQRRQHRHAHRSQRGRACEPI